MTLNHFCHYCHFDRNWLDRVGSTTDFSLCPVIMVAGFELLVSAFILIKCAFLLVLLLKTIVVDYRPQKKDTFMVVVHHGNSVYILTR